jgi:hypothetical protein
MNWLDSVRQNHPFFSRCISCVLFTQITLGLLFLIISPVIAASDTPPGSDPRIGWEKSFGRSIEGGTYSIIATSDGGSVVIGNNKSNQRSSSLYIFKTDAYGNKVWDWTDAGSSYEGYSIIETPDNGYVVAGSSNTSNGISLMKLDPVGKMTWIQQFNKGQYYAGNYISTTGDSGFIVGGSVLRNDTYPLSHWEVYTLKADAEGREQWTGYFMGEKNYYAKFIRQTEDGGYIIAGTAESFGTGSSNTFLLKTNEFGNKEWFATYEGGGKNEKLSVIQTPDGGYILLGTSPSATTNQQYKDLFLVRTDDRGQELWEKKISGMGKTMGNILTQAENKITVIAGSYLGSEGEKTSEIISLDFDLSGNEKRNRTFSMGQSIDIQDIAVFPGDGYFVTGISTDQESLQKNRLTIIKVLDTPPSVVPAKNSFDLTVLTKDAKTGTFMGGAQIYLDGGSVGSTSEKDGKQILSEVQRGTHTIRVAKTGFEEITRSVDISEKKQVSFTLNRSKIIPVQIHGSTDDKIDVVFVASKTSFNCNSKIKIQTEVYSGDQKRFVFDVNNKVESVFLKLDTLTSGFVGLPKDFRERFNFYYYWDNENFADAFDGCAGTLPGDFWSDAPFTDVAIILYPSYEGFYSGPPCEPNGCANGLGPGSGSWLKAPADSPAIFLHESGHVVFGLIDTYCGDTYYVENSPYPNVWSSESSCKKYAEQERWDVLSCRQIVKPASSRSKNPCVKNFWKADTDPDIMGSGAYSGRFGNASTSRIRYIFDTINRWQK